MSSSLNQRIHAVEQHTRKNRTQLSLKWSVLALALSTAILSPSIAAESLLDANQQHISNAAQRNLNFEQILQDVKRYQAGTGVWHTQPGLAF